MNFPWRIAVGFRNLKLASKFGLSCLFLLRSKVLAAGALLSFSHPGGRRRGMCRGSWPGTNHPNDTLVGMLQSTHVPARSSTLRALAHTDQGGSWVNNGRSGWKWLLGELAELPKPYQAHGILHLDRHQHVPASLFCLHLLLPTIVTYPIVFLAYTHTGQSLFGLPFHSSGRREGLQAFFFLLCRLWLSSMSF